MIRRNSSTLTIPGSRRLGKQTDYSWSIANFNTLKFQGPATGPFTYGQRIDFASFHSVAGDKTYISNSGKLGTYVNNGGSCGIQFIPILAGDFDIQCSYDVGDFPGTSICDIGLRIFSVTSSVSDYVWNIYHYDSGWKVTFPASINNVWTGLTQYNYSTSSSKMRIVRNGNIFTGYYWNGSWTSLGTQTLNNFGTYGVIELGGNNWRNTTHAELLFYDFFINSGTLCNDYRATSRIV